MDVVTVLLDLCFQILESLETLQGEGFKTLGGGKWEGGREGGSRG